ncbi:MAG: hydrogen gas-evolving membrane-bound hydrogenase subunit E, partial [Parachlamydiaceae bacterium]
VTLYFVFFKAPDLAMTQILVEVVTGMMLLVMVWVFRREKRIIESRWRFGFRWAAAALVAATSAMIVLTYSDREISKPLAEYFLTSSLPLADGSNSVNVILVDFRGMDTLGEITVLLIAAMGIIGLVSKTKKPEISFAGRMDLIPSDILRSLIPAVFFTINFFALYLLVRGHNEVGGGFIAGLASGIAFILLDFILQLGNLKKILPVNLLLFSGSGIFLSFMVGVLPILFEKAFLTHSILDLPTALFFDVGVFVAVLGVVLIGVFALRSDALRVDGHHG